jgi:hypothetical protein
MQIGAVRWKGHCSKHPRYNPEFDGLGGIRGGCRRCEMLLDIYRHHSALVRLIREFGAREKPLIVEPNESDRQMSLLDLR